MLRKDINENIFAAIYEHRIDLIPLNKWILPVFGGESITDATPSGNDSSSTYSVSTIGGSVDDLFCGRGSGVVLYIYSK